MKIIDLINLRAEGKNMPKKIRIDHWCYNFEWIEHESNYYDRNAEIDLMSCLSMNKEELNYEVEIIEEDKEIEKLSYYSLEKIQKAKNEDEHYKRRIELLEKRVDDYHNKINELIDKINNLQNK